MKIRKIQYNINYSHILSFKDEYKKITAPYFGWNHVRYSIDQYNSIHEALRLIFTDYDTVMHFRKDGITIMFEGDENTFFSDSSLIKEYFTMYESIVALDCFTKTQKHDLLIYGVDTENPAYSSDYLKVKCPEELIDFACTYHYNYKNYEIHKTIGDFIPSDIEKYELSPFKTKQNQDLFEVERGKMCEFRMIEITHEPSLPKLKKLITEANKQIDKF